MAASRAQSKRSRRAGKTDRGTGSRGGARKGRVREPAWAALDDESLLDVRLRDLGVQVEGSTLEGRVEALHRELARAGLRFRPSIWLSFDWFSPDGVPGFAAPFYLAHPRLARLEARMMLQVEGGGVDSCMRFLRHETAHALDNAYGLRRRKRWRETFGPPGQRYEESYVPNPTSNQYVHNLDYWYAQSHPFEDFAETFAVWLEPGSEWRERYRGWPALDKLRYVDELMREIGPSAPRVRSRARPDSLASLRTTLREHYRWKQAHYHDDLDIEYDESLERVFDSEGRGESAARFLERRRRFLRQHVAAVTGQNHYLISQVMNDLVLRCRARKLRRTRPEDETLVMTASLMTMLTQSFVARPPPSYLR